MGIDYLFLTMFNVSPRNLQQGSVCMMDTVHILYILLYLLDAFMMMRRHECIIESRIRLTAHRPEPVHSASKKYSTIGTCIISWYCGTQITVVKSPIWFMIIIIR